MKTSDKIEAVKVAAEALASKDTRTTTEDIVEAVKVSLEQTKQVNQDTDKQST